MFDSKMDEALRLFNYNKNKNELLEKGYEEHEGTISVLVANVMALMTAGPIALIFINIYIFFYKDILIPITLKGLIWFCVALVLSIPIHELLHGLLWLPFVGGSFQKIHFGVIWKYLTPYCHCKEPLTFKQYTVGSLAPLVIIGLGSFVLSMILKSPAILYWSCIATLSCGGDTTIIYMAFKYRHGLILDHPEKCGFVAFTKKPVVKTLDDIEAPVIIDELDAWMAQGDDKHNGSNGKADSTVISSTAISSTAISSTAISSTAISSTTISTTIDNTTINSSNTDNSKDDKNIE